MSKLLETVMALAAMAEVKDMDRMEKYAVRVGMAWGASRKTVPCLEQACCLVGWKTDWATAKYLAVYVQRAARITAHYSKGSPT